MEIFKEHITQEKIKSFLEKESDTVWLTLCDELCILQGIGWFNNPTNLPVYHTHEQGGIIVCFPEDICFGIVSSNNTIGIRFLNYLQTYLYNKGKVEILNNDLLFNGKKVFSYSCLDTGNKYITTAHISMNMDLELITKICKKPMLNKVPGGLIDFGFNKQEMLDLTLDFLNPLDPEYHCKTDPIDICVMWVSPSSKRWIEQKSKYMKEEIQRGTQKFDSSAAFGEARYRDWGIFKYWFRGVEQNCPWVNHVFLILEDEDQIPSWLNIDNPKLIIKYHRDFIPKEALPQYNGPAIEMWYWNIPELSDNFIACDDDYFFFNPIPENLLFNNNRPQTSHQKDLAPPEKIFLPLLGTWGTMLYNNDVLIKELTGVRNSYLKSHLPEPRKKSFEAKIFKENYEKFYNALMYSHFRSPKSYTAWLFVDLAKIMNISDDKKVFNNSKYLPINSNLSDIVIKNNLDKQMICFNDVDGRFNSYIQELLINVFEKHFPNKSSFEI